MEDNSAFIYGSEKSTGNILTGVIFSQVGMFVIVAMYACAGAAIFVEIEKDAEKARFADKIIKAEEVEQTIDYTTHLLWFYGDEQEFNWTYQEYNKTVFKDLKILENFVLDAVENHHYDDKEGWNYDWTFMNCLLLTMTIMTTIGYGHIAPKTFEGQMFCICYALIGSPLFLVFLANLGTSMANAFTFIYSRFCCRCCRSRRYLSEVPENRSKKWSKQVMDDVVGDEEYMPTNTLFVPITIVLVLLHAYMIVGALLFKAWEGWGLTAAYYFTFITISTIGYGDYVPGNSLADSSESMMVILKMLLAVLYIVLGMALLSMCINLMQEQIVEKCRWLAHEIGLSSNNEVKEANLDGQDDALNPLVGNDGVPVPVKNKGAKKKKAKGKKAKKNKKPKKNKTPEEPLSGLLDV